MLSRSLVHTPLCILPPTGCWNGPSTLKGKGLSHVSCALWAFCTDWSSRECRPLCLPTSVMKPRRSARFRLRKNSLTAGSPAQRINSSAQAPAKSAGCGSSCQPCACLTLTAEVMPRVPSQRTGMPQPHGGPARSQRLSPAPHEYEHPLRPLLAPTS
jgi:hypothetical protein